MIKVDDLIEWARQNAIGRSTSYPNGWIDATALKKLVDFIVMGAVAFIFTLID